MQIGAQFFTVRQFTKTLDDLSLTLRKVADIGYKTVQLSATCPFEPEWMKEQLAANGLKCVVTHVRGDRLTEETAAVAAEHEADDAHQGKQIQVGPTKHFHAQHNGRQRRIGGAAEQSD